MKSRANGGSHAVAYGTAERNSGMGPQKDSRSPFRGAPAVSRRWTVDKMAVGLRMGPSSFCVARSGNIAVAGTSSAAVVGPLGPSAR